MISARTPMGQGWKRVIRVATLGVSLWGIVSASPAFGQACSNQSQIDNCVAETCGVCEFVSGPCGQARVNCVNACSLALTQCFNGCGADGTCLVNCLMAHTQCNAACEPACNTCVAQCRAPCDNLCIVCDSGGPYSIACDAPAPHVIQLDGSGSSDPQGGELTYEWVYSCSGGTLDDDAIENPKLTLEPPLNCRTCFVTLYLTDEDGGSATCNDLVHITDETPPEVGRPEPIEDCYEFVAGAQSAACEVLGDVASDNCDPSLTCQATDSTGPNENCEYSVSMTVLDACENRSEAVEFHTRIDGELPTATCSAVQTEYEVDENCEAIVKFTGEMKDNCCLAGNLGSIGIKARDGAAFVESVGPGLICSTELSDDEKTLDIECAFKVYALRKCPAVAELNFSGRDCCGNEPAEDCVATTNVVDKINPQITCPPPITLERGDKLCNDDVKNWLESASATDNCGGDVTVTTDAPACGFPPGTTTTVTFTAHDACGNTKSCSSDITIEPLRRASSDQKGSLLIFPDVEIRWNDGGQLVQDTILDVSNDAAQGSVDVQAWFINGDRPLEEIIDPNSGTLLQEFEPGWNTADCRFELTKNQPHFWSAARGSAKCQPFTVLDEDGRPGGSRILRGYVVMVAVKFVPTTDPTMATAGADEPGFFQEIRWNHLKGDALVIDYERGAAWEYNAVAYQARCGATGEPLLDCIERDDKGACCEARVRPGRLDMDGFQYDANYDVLLLDFYASGSTALTRGNVTVMVDTDLTLHTVDTDLRQDGNGPVLIKAEFEIYNENESKFSGTRRCICCWDQTLLSDYARDVSVPSHFLRSVLRTDKGMARINGVFSEECDYEDVCGFRPTKAPVVKLGASRPLLGVAAKQLTFSGTTENYETAGMNLPGSGTESGTIRFDVPPYCGDGEVNQPDEQCDDGNVEECDGCTSDCTRRVCDPCVGGPTCVLNTDCIPEFECVNSCCRECLGRICEDNDNCEPNFECVHGCCRPVD